MRIRAVAVVLLFLLRSVYAATASADAGFEAAAKAFIDDYLRLNPEEATDLGDHRYDDRLRDYSTAATNGQLAAWRKHLVALARIDPAKLTGPNRVDAQIMRTHLDAMIFELMEIKSRE